MNPDAVSSRNTRRRLALALGLFLFSVYLFTYRGGFHSVDEVSIFAVTESLAKFGQFNTDQIAWTQWTTSQAEAQGFFGEDGHVYSKKGLALSLAQAPLYWLALLLPGLGMLQTVSLLNALITATTGLLIFMFLWRMQYSPTVAVFTALIFGVATLAFVYAKYLFSEPLAGFLLLLAAYMLFAYKQEGGLRHVAIAGLAAGFAVLTRANNLFLLPVFGLYLLWVETGNRVTSSKVAELQHATRFTFYVSRLTQKSTWQAIFTFIIALAIPGIILLAYNAIRSGNPLQTGYDLTLFSPNILLGFYKLLFSPLRGLFVYSPILLLSIPGWWLLRKRFAAEAWMFLGLVGITVGLFSAWSSGEGLSWGSRFLVPLVPFFAIALAPIVEQGSGVRSQGSASKVASSKIAGSTAETQFATRNTQPKTLNSEPETWNAHYVLRFTFYVLLFLSFLIQILGVAINPWVYLAKLQTDFGGELFLENTAALYNFRYSQIVGQLQSWSIENSDIAWLRWGFEPLAFGASLALVIASGWLLWRALKESSSRVGESQRDTHHALRFTFYVLLPLLITYFLLTRYNQTDLQFGPPNDAYTQALNTIAAQAEPNEQIITVAQYHYHVPMNRFKARVPLVGFAQQTELPDTALPLLTDATAGENGWLVTVGFPPAAADNAAERWLVYNAFKASDEWLPDDVRLVRFSTLRPNTTRPINAMLGSEIQLQQVDLLDTAHPGQALPLEFSWLPQIAPTADYNIFVQLLNIDGTLVAQHDSPPNGGYAPTTGWQSNQKISSRHALPLPLDLPPGDYRLIVGLVNPATGQRLATTEGPDFVELGIVTVND